MACIHNGSPPHLAPSSPPPGSAHSAASTVPTTAPPPLPASHHQWCDEEQHAPSVQGVLSRSAPLLPPNTTTSMTAAGGGMKRFSSPPFSAIATTGGPPPQPASSDGAGFNGNESLGDGSGSSCLIVRPDAIPAATTTAVEIGAPPTSSGTTAMSAAAATAPLLPHSLLARCRPRRSDNDKRVFTPFHDRHTGVRPVHTVPRCPEGAPPLYNTASASAFRRRGLALSQLIATAVVVEASPAAFAEAASGWNEGRLNDEVHGDDADDDEDTQPLMMPNAAVAVTATCLKRDRDACNGYDHDDEASVNSCTTAITSDDEESSDSLLGRGAFGVVRRVVVPKSDDDDAGIVGGTLVVVARKSVPLAVGVGDTAGGANRAVRTELAVARRIHALAARRPEAARHLLRVHAVRVGQTEAAIDMELLDAGDLARFAPLPSDAHVAAVARQLLRGLRALHRDVRAIHRDMKLQNALASRDGRVRLVDFGCAALAAEHAGQSGDDDSDSADDSNVITATDQQGTVLQMAPERLRGEPHGAASDVWGLGVMLAELATGAHPFVPADAARRLGSTERFWALAEVIRHTATAAECAEATDAAVATALAGCSPGLRGFVGGMLRAAPGSRATVDELLAHPFLRLVLGTPGHDADDGDTSLLADLFAAVSLHATSIR